MLLMEQKGILEDKLHIYTLNSFFLYLLFDFIES